jgi:hypothetical protein
MEVHACTHELASCIPLSCTLHRHCLALLLLTMATVALGMSQLH